MTGVKPVFVAAAAAVALIALGGARRPLALAPASGGMWEVSGSGLRVPQKLCIADPAVLAQFEHRGHPCTRMVISDTPPSTVIHYTCVRGGFGRSKLTVITPRSIRIETQGIADDLPFNYLVQARRVGDCPPLRAAAH